MIKFLLKLLGLIIIDFILIWIWVYEMNPDPSVSIALIGLVPLVFIINLIIAGVLTIFKLKDFAIIFLINSIIASILMYYLFDRGIARNINKAVDRWEFQKNDTTFILYRWKNTNDFSMSFSLVPGSSGNFLEGKYILLNIDWILTTDKLKMKIHNDTLIGFRKESDTIPMKKIKR